MIVSQATCLGDLRGRPVPCLECGRPISRGALCWALRAGAPHYGGGLWCRKQCYESSLALGKVSPRSGVKWPDEEGS